MHDPQATDSTGPDYPDQVQPLQAVAKHSTLDYRRDFELVEGTIYPLACGPMSAARIAAVVVAAAYGLAQKMARRKQRTPEL